MLHLIARLFVSLAIVCASVSVAFAQSIGTFRFGLAPCCNVVTLSVTQLGGSFTLDGFDDQCGAATRASVVGTAFPILMGRSGSACRSSPHPAPHRSTSMSR